MEGTTNTMANLIEQITPVMTEIFDTVATVCTTIVGQPLLLMTVGFLFAGGVIGIFGRLLSRG